MINSRRVKKDEEFMLEVFTPRKRPVVEVKTGVRKGMFVPFEEHQH
jgi:hypothetical protein